MRTSPHGLLGSEYFFDHVHPTVGGHAEIARVLTRALGASDDAVRADAVAAIAREPDVEKGMHAAKMLIYITLGWYDDAYEDLERAARVYPDFVKFRSAVDQARSTDTVPARRRAPTWPTHRIDAGVGVHPFRRSIARARRTDVPEPTVPR
jgi:hypothetical protein